MQLPFAFLLRFLPPAFAHKAVTKAKKTLRKKVYNKLISLGAAYNNHTTTAGIVQTAGEGIESLDSYFGKYLPQFFYSMLAPVTLFAAMSFISVKPALILLALCSPDSAVYRSFYESGKKNDEKTLECLHRSWRHIS